MFSLDPYRNTSDLKTRRNDTGVAMVKGTTGKVKQANYDCFEPW